MNGARTMTVVSCMAGLLLGWMMIGSAGAPALAASSPDAVLPWPAELQGVAENVGQWCDENKFADARALVLERLAAATDYEQRACLLRFLGKTYEREKSYDLATTYYRRVIEYFPDSGLQVSWAKRDLAWTYVRKADLGSRTENLQAAVNLLADFAQSYPGHQKIEEMWLWLGSATRSWATRRPRCRST